MAAVDNAFGTLFYLLMFVITMLLLKWSVGFPEKGKNIAQPVGANTLKGTAQTIMRFLLWRYTVASIRLRNKKYLLLQLLSMALFSVSSLKINKIIFWQLGLAPLSLIVSFLLNDYPHLKAAQPAIEV